MRRVVLFIVAAAFGLAVCSPAAGLPRVSPSDPGSVGPAAPAVARTAVPNGAQGATDVKNLTTGLEFSTLQAAIDDPGTLAGHVLEVQVGTHAEGICTVSKAVTIQGGGGGAVVTSTTDTGTSGDARAWFLITVPGVTFRDLTLDGSANVVWQALRFKEAGAVDHCTIQHIKSLPVHYNGVGIVGYKNVSVTDCTFSDCGRIGVVLFGADVTAGVISGCTYTGKGPGDWLDYGIELGAGAVAVVTNNTVTGCAGVALVDGSGSAGTLVTTYFGVGTTGTYTGNVLAGNSVGLFVGYDVADVSTVVAHSNDLSSNPEATLANISATKTVDASANWWGASTPAGVAATIYGTVDHSPWLAVGTDVSGDPGFQGDLSGLWVDDDGAQTGTKGRIQEAVDLVSGSIVDVAAGLYDERVTIDKAMTLRGATYGVSKRGFAVPPAYAYDPATQSIIRPSTALEQPVVKLAADGAVFDGFVVANEVCATGGVYQDLVAVDQNLAATTGVQVLNCVLGPNTNTAAQDGTKGRSGVTVYGPHSHPVKLIVKHSYIFDSKGNGCGIMLVGPYGPTYHGGTVYANYFAGTVIEDNDILGNHRTGIELAGGIQGGAAWDEHVVIRDNLVAGNGWFALAEKDNLKFGHGIMCIRGGGDRANADGAGSRYVRFEDNEIRDNEKSGLYLGPRNRDLFATGNTIRDNGKGTGGYGLWDGVRVDLDELYYGGLALPDHAFLANVSFADGGILGNGALGVDVMQTLESGPMAVTCNWWGDALGPNVLPGNPSPANGIVGLATYSPWWSTATGPCDGVNPNVVAPVTAGLCISTVHPCVTVPVMFTRADVTPARGVSVTFRIDTAKLALCGSVEASIRQGAWLGAYGTTYEVVDNGDGSYTVDQAILGEPCGVTTGGELFTVDLMAAGPDGDGAITVTDVRARDCGNAALAGIAGAPGAIPVDQAAPAVVALTAVQQRTGNDGDGTTKVAVTWPAVESGATVHVYRAGFGNYPEYDDAPGSGAVPATPAYPPGAPWVLAGDVVGSGLTDEVGARDYWYYVAFVEDACGNVSAVSNKTGGTLNYHLGDVSDGVTACLGNNRVFTEDISLLGGHYGIALGVSDALGCLDVGPTTNRYVDGRPLTDNRVNFEDLMMFAINFNLVSAPQDALALVPGRGGLTVEAPERVAAGSTFTVALRMSGAGDVQGLSAQLGWDGAVAEPVAVEAGGLMAAQNGVVLSGAPGLVDAALLGRDRGIVGEGVVATVTFRALASGAPAVVLAKVDARDASNQPVALAGVGLGVPERATFAPAAPNPFRGTTVLSYALAKSGPVELAVYGVDGRKVATLASGVQEPGSYRLTWDGAGARPGLYYARLTTSEGRITRTLVLTK